MSVATERFKKNMKSVRKCLTFLGCDVFVDNFKICRMTCYSIALIIIYYILGLYTVKTTSSEDLIIIMPHASSVILATLAVTKLYTFLKYAPDMHSINEWISGIIEKYEKAGGEFQHAVSIYLDRLEKVWRFLRIIYGVPSLSLMTFPLAYYLVFGKKILFVEYTMGDFSKETAFLYIVLIQGAQIASFGVGQLVSDYLIIMHVINTALLVDIMKAKLNCIERKMLNIETDTTQSSITLQDVARWHIDFCGFTELARTVFSVQISTQVIACTIVISVTIITAVFGNWVPGYMLSLTFYTILFSYCLIGTIFEMLHDSLTEKLYDFKWYLLPVRDQKILLMLLMKSQHPNLLNIMGLAPLNMSTGVQVTKSIYSYMMMLRRVLE